MSAIDIMAASGRETSACLAVAAVFAVGDADTDGIFSDPRARRLVKAERGRSAAGVFGRKSVRMRLLGLRGV